METYVGRETARAPPPKEDPCAGGRLLVELECHVDAAAEDAHGVIGRAGRAPDGTDADQGCRS